MLLSDIQRVFFLSLALLAGQIFYCRRKLIILWRDVPRFKTSGNIMVGWVQDKILGERKAPLPVLGTGRATNGSPRCPQRGEPRILSCTLVGWPHEDDFGGRFYKIRPLLLAHGFDQHAVTSSAFVLFAGTRESAEALRAKIADIDAAFTVNWEPEE
jgi:hypothetical protein